MRTRSLLALTLAALMILTACAKQVPTSGSDPAAAPTSKAPEAITITVLTSFDSTALDVLIAGFHAKYPGARVSKLQVPPGPNAEEQALRMIRDGEADVLPTFQVMTAKAMVEAGLLMPLDPYIQKSKFDLSPLGAGVEGLRMEGKLYDLPYMIDPHVIVINKDLFQKKGVALPRPGWTWEEFRQTAVSLTEGSGEQKIWGVADPNPEHLARYWLLQQAGDRFLTDETAMKDALRFFSTLIFTDQVVRPSAPMDSPTQTMPHKEPFRLGLGAMSRESLQWVGQSRAGATFNWDVVPMPVLPGARAVQGVELQAYGIAAASRQPDGAWEFITFASGPEGALALAKAGILPAYRNQQVKTAWFDRSPAPSPGTEAFFTADWRPVGRSLDWDLAVVRPFVYALNNAFSGQQPWEEAYSQWQREVRAATGKGGN